MVKNGKIAPEKKCPRVPRVQGGVVIAIGQCPHRGGASLKGASLTCVVTSWWNAALKMKSLGFSFSSILFKLLRSRNKNWTHKNKSDWGQDLRVSWYIMELLSTSIYNSFARVSITLYIPPWERNKTFLSYHISSYLASSKIPDHTCWPGWSKVLPWICLQIQCHCWWLHTQAAQHMFLRNGWVVQTNQPE